MRIGISSAIYICLCEDSSIKSKIQYLFSGNLSGWHLSVTIYGDTGRYPLFLKQQILALKYWICLISLPKSCYLRNVYSSLASLDFISKTNWCSHIRSLLFRTNHCDVWENHRVESANRLIKQVKLCLINT